MSDMAESIIAARRRLLQVYHAPGNTRLQCIDVPSSLARFVDAQLHEWCTIDSYARGGKEVGYVTCTSVSRLANTR